MNGYIYILSNPSMPGILKIGKTERCPEERISELSSVTGIPTEFVLEYKVHVPDCDIAEKKVHEFLRTFRVSNNREFFKIGVDEVKNIIRENIAGLIGDELLKYDNGLIVKVIDYIFLKNKTIRTQFR